MGERWVPCLCPRSRPVWGSERLALFPGAVVGGGLCCKGRRVGRWRSASSVPLSSAWCLPRVVASLGPGLPLGCRGVGQLALSTGCRSVLCRCNSSRKGTRAPPVDGDVQGGGDQGRQGAGVQAASLAACLLSLLWVGIVSSRIFPPGGELATSSSQCPSRHCGHFGEDTVLPCLVRWLCLACLASRTHRNPSLWPACLNDTGLEDGRHSGGCKLWEARNERGQAVTIVFLFQVLCLRSTHEIFCLYALRKYCLGT